MAAIAIGLRLADRLGPSSFLTRVLDQCTKFRSIFADNSDEQRTKLNFVHKY
jgi:hypothetical protein